MSFFALVGRWARSALTIPIRAYRFFLSPWLGMHCRFEPTCSAYALEAIDRHGALDGTYLAARRLIRCRPGCPGGHDPVPPAPLCRAGHGRRGQ